MKIVGDHLASTAFSNRADPERFDLFARSAFNRYYYSVFLTVRAAVRQIDPKWATPTHQQLPDLLTGKVVERVRKAISVQERNGLIKEGDASRLHAVAKGAAADLANLLRTAREVRRVADYEPEERVSTDGDTATLAKCTTAEASEWPQRADTWARAILDAYGQLNLI